jgi:hypothetical protein
VKLASCIARHVEKPAMLVRLDTFEPVAFGVKCRTFKVSRLVWPRTLGRIAA